MLNKKIEDTRGVITPPPPPLMNYKMIIESLTPAKKFSVTPLTTTTCGNTGYLNTFGTFCTKLIITRRTFKDRVAFVRFKATGTRGSRLFLALSNICERVRVILNFIRVPPNLTFE